MRSSSRGMGRGTMGNFGLLLPIGLQVGNSIWKAFKSSQEKKQKEKMEKEHKPKTWASGTYMDGPSGRLYHWDGHKSTWL